MQYEREEPIPANIRELMNDIGNIIGRVIQKQVNKGEEKYGFALFMFDFKPGRISYISNANREDMLAALKEFIAKHEGRFDDSIDFTKRMV